MTQLLRIWPVQVSELERIEAQIILLEARLEALRMKSRDLRQLAPVMPLTQLLDEISQKHSLPLAMLKSRRRDRPIAWARQEFMYRARTEQNATLGQIRWVLGGLDHSTVSHGIKAHARRIDTLKSAQPAVQ